MSDSEYEKLPPHKPQFNGGGVQFGELFDFIRPGIPTKIKWLSVKKLLKIYPKKS